MNIYNRILINLSIRPYKVVKLDTQLLVKHYKNGRLEATRIKPKLSNGVSRSNVLGIKRQPLKSIPCPNKEQLHP